MPWLDLPFKEIDVNQVYRKDTNLKKEDVEILIKWVESQPHLPHTTELQIILFLHSTLYNVEKAKATIDHYFTAKTSSKELFGSRTLKDPLFNTATKCILMAPLMTLTSSGDMIMIGKLMDYNIGNYTPAGHIRLFDVTTLLFLHQTGPANGLQIIADLTNASFSHFFKYSTSVVRTFVNYLQDALPIRLKYLHLINVAYFVDKFILLAKPIMRKELYESIKVHTNIETLYEYIPKDLLPQDYGGLSDSSQILQDKIITKIEDSKDFLIFQENQDVNESKRPRLTKKIKSRIGGIENLKQLKN